MGREGNQRTPGEESRVAMCKSVCETKPGRRRLLEFRAGEDVIDGRGEGKRPRIIAASSGTGREGGLDSYLPIPRARGEQKIRADGGAASDK